MPRKPKNVDTENVELNEEVVDDLEVDEPDEVTQIISHIPKVPELEKIKPLYIDANVFYAVDSTHFTYGLGIIEVTKTPPRNVVSLDKGVNQVLAILYSNYGDVSLFARPDIVGYSLWLDGKVLVIPAYEMCRYAEKVNAPLDLTLDPFGSRLSSEICQLVNKIYVDEVCLQNDGSVGFHNAAGTPKLLSPVMDIPLWGKSLTLADLGLLCDAVNGVVSNGAEHPVVRFEWWDTLDSAELDTVMHIGKTPGLDSERDPLFINELYSDDNSTGDTGIYNFTSATVKVNRARLVMCSPRVLWFSMIFLLLHLSGAPGYGDIFKRKLTAFNALNNWGIVDADYSHYEAVLIRCPKCLRMRMLMQNTGSSALAGTCISCGTTY